MARQSIDVFLSAHEREDDWPLQRGTDAAGRGTVVCRGCGEELPDGVAVEPVGKAKARAVTYATPPPAHEWPDGPYGDPPPREVASVLHECGRSGG